MLGIQSICNTFLIISICYINVVKNAGEGSSVFHFESEEDLDDNLDIYRRNYIGPKHVNFYTSQNKVKKSKDYYKNSQPVIDKYQFNVEENTKALIDRKDTINFYNIEDLFPSERNDFLTSDYGQFETSPNRYEDTPLKVNHGDSLKKIYPSNNENNYYYAKDKTEQQNYNNLYEYNKRKNSYFYNNYSSLFATQTDNLDTNDSNRTKLHEYSADIYQTNLNDNTEEMHDNLYVQKVPLMTVEDSSTTTMPVHSLLINPNKYEEVDITTREISKNNSDTFEENRQKINNLLKQYLIKMFIGKYGGKSKYFNNTAGVYNNFTHNKLSNINLESKFLPGNNLWNLKNKTMGKIKKLFSLFTVIKFNNSECNTTNGAGTWQGICYTSSECTQMGGTAFGNCASGYGVCCIFRGTCGDSSSRNCSYFKSPNYPDYYPSSSGVITPTTTVAPTTGVTPDPRLHWYYYTKGGGDKILEDAVSGRQSNSDSLSCVFSIYKTNSDVQQLRIDFLDLDLASPTNGTCQTERLIISGQNANDQIPVLCGYNTGQHVYVDVSQLNGPLQIMVLSTNGTQKRFKMRICQYSDTCTTSQSNCLQYYTGITGVIQSFNYDQAAMFNRSNPGYFNNLNYAICIRREAGYCSVTYTNVQNGQMYPFQLVNQFSNGQSTVPQGQAGVDILNCPDDYIIIDGTRLCGERFNDGSTSANFSTNAPVVDTSTGPIVINVRTNNNVTGLGFKLYYTQNQCT